MAARRAFAAPPVLFVAAAVGVVLMAVSGRYGYHRDELYFLAASHHLAFGFVDQPPFVPFVAWLANTVLGGSPTALRLLPALSLGVVVVITALIAREFGAGWLGQSIAALAAATDPEFLGAAHLLSTTPFDILTWAALLYLFVRIVGRGEERLWLLAGVVVGVGLLNKWNIAFLAGALGVGLLLSTQRRRLASPWLLGGVGIALLIWTPNLIWETRHDWPSIDMLRSLHRENLDDGDPGKFIPAQLIYAGVVLLPVWVSGLVWLARNPAARAYRAIVWAFVLLCVFYLVTAGKPYYIAGLYVPLLAAGGLAVEAWLERRRTRLRRPGGVIGAMLVGGLVAALIALPIVPPATLSTVALQDVNYDLGETIGWPRFVDEIAGVYASLPPRERARAVVLASNYGEGGAVDRYGPSRGLPNAYSGHNNFWWWGPPPGKRSSAVVAVGFGRHYLRRFFGEVHLARRLDNGLGVSDDEQGSPVWICRHQRGSWAALWPHLRHYG